MPDAPLISVSICTEMNLIIEHLIFSAPLILSSHINYKKGYGNLKNLNGLGWIKWLVAPVHKLDVAPHNFQLFNLKSNRLFIKDDY